MKINTNYFFYIYCTGCTVLYSGVQPCTVCSIIAQLCRLQPTIARDVLFCTVEYNHVGSVTALLMQITTYCCSGIWRAKFILLHVGNGHGTRYEVLVTALLCRLFITNCFTGVLACNVQPIHTWGWSSTLETRQLQKRERGGGKGRGGGG